MEIEGKIWKSGTTWLVEIPALDAMTQGKTRKEVVAMATDLVLEMAETYFKVKKGFKVAVIDYKKNVIGITASDNKVLLALSLRRQREKSGSTVREVSERLGSKSPNAYGQYERGKTNIPLDKYEKLLMAASPLEKLRLKIA